MTTEGSSLRLAILASHPVQYYAPLFRTLAAELDVHVFYAHKTSPQEQGRAGFGAAFEWDVDLLSGYSHEFLRNVSKAPGTDRFSGCDTPEIAARLRDGRFDVVLAAGWHLKSYVQGVIAAKKLRKPLMVRGDSHLETPRSRIKTGLKRLTYPLLLRQFDAALYVGARSRAYYLHYGFPPERLFFSPHCVDAGWFAARADLAARARIRQRFGIGAQTRLALFAGKLLAAKRPFDLIDAVALCRAQGQDLACLIAGAGPLQASLAARAAQSGTPLHFLGFCNQTEMPAAYAAADVLVLPSDGHETWGLVANEALACGKPIIVSDACGCAPDLAVDRAGRSFAVGDVQALARVLVDLCRHPPDPAEVAALSARYSRDAAADGILAAVDSLATRRSSSTALSVAGGAP